MKTKSKSPIGIACHSIATPLFAGALLLVGENTGAQPMFVSDYFGGNIYTFTQGGGSSLFVSGLSYPEALAFDSAGNLFVGELLSGNIYKFTPGGVRSLFASGVGNANEMDFDTAGNLFVNDFSSGNIYKITPGGIRTTFASGLQHPQGMAFDSAGNLFVAQGDVVGNRSIDRFSPDGTRSIFASGLDSPYGLVFDAAGNLFAADGPGYICEFTPQGGRSTFVGGAYNVYNNLDFDGAGNLWVAELLSGQGEVISAFSPDGTRTATFSTGLGAFSSLDFQPVPEPSSVVLGAIGIGILLGIRHSRKFRRSK